MIVSNHLHLIAIGMIVAGLGMRAWGQDDVTILAPPPTTPASSVDGGLAPDGTPVVHKSFHKKKESNATVISTPSTLSTEVQALNKQSSTVKTWPTASAPMVASSTAPSGSSSLGPAVETGLPIARHSLTGSTTVNEVSIPTSTIVPSAHYGSPEIAPPKSLPPVIPTTVASYSPPTRSQALDDDMMPINSTGKKGPKNTYPWKTNIVTTVFWIGEGGSSVSSTDNVASSWDEEWLSSNSGSDSPVHRNGYAPAYHAATLNPFYVALPFNDLAYPDEARRWLPAGWHRPPKNGKQVSACKDRWVEIKAEDGSGHVCYAQWEDVGPLRSDNAEYVFGSERPTGLGSLHAGLDVSPAVAQYLKINTDKKAITRWRFVDAEDVPPGEWLKLGEEALIYTALRELEKSGRSSNPPVQRASAPITDPSNVDSNQKKVNAHKG